MMRKDFKRLGDFIREVNVCNLELKITKPTGINIDKHFMPSVANVIGTDLSAYKLVNKNQFACNLMHVGRDERIPVALHTENEPIIVSPAYFVFEIINANALLPEYLMILFNRPEFDRNAWFYTDADVRGGLSKNALMNIRLPIPDIDEQRNIVAEYKIIKKSIENNNHLMKVLENTAKAIYHHTFVENIDPENLPTGWMWGTISEFCDKMTSGGTPNRSENSYWNKKEFRWLKTGEVHNNVVLDTEEYISQKGLENSSAKIIPKGSITVAMYCANGVTGGQVAYLNCDATTNQACCNMICKNNLDASFLFFYFINRQEEIKRLASGTAQDNLSQTIIAEQKILLFDDDSIKEKFEVVLNNLVSLYQENDILKRIQNLLLSKLS